MTSGFGRAAIVCALALAAAAPTAVTAADRQDEVIEAASVADARWGPLTRLAGAEWRSRLGRFRFVWTDPGLTLVQQQRPLLAGDWSDVRAFTLRPQGVVVSHAGVETPLIVDASGGVSFARPGAGDMTLVLEGEGVRVREARTIAGDYLLTRTPGGWAQDDEVRLAAEAVMAQGPAPAPDAARPRGPIILSGGPPSPAAGRATATAASNPAAGVSANPSGPIVIAAAPPPPAPTRQGPRQGQGRDQGQGEDAGTATSREAQMRAQVEAQRLRAEEEARTAQLRAAQQAEAERVRQAERAQQEARRRAEAQSRSNAWGEAFAFVGALAGGVIAGSYTGGDMTAISAGMAAGAQIGGSQTEIAQATATNFNNENARYQAEQAQQRELHERTMAALNDPTNPLTQQMRREEAEREANNRTARREMEARHRAEEEQAVRDREALMNQRLTEARAEELDRQRRQAEDELRRQEQRAADAERQRQQEVEELRQQEEQRRQAAERDRLAREAEQRRVAEARRLEQERLEAERTRLVDFREAVVICQLSGPQAQFGNWDCQGPLQQNYVNFERPNVASAMNLMSCRNYRELPRAGSYRVFGCGYGLHPNNPGAFRNVPEMMGVYVDGRAIFRCPVNSADICRNR